MRNVALALMTFALAATAATAQMDCGNMGTSDSNMGAMAAPTAKKTTTSAIKCPVTGEKIADPAKAPGGKSVYKGKTYYFCCAGCKPKFDKNPAKYVKNSAKGKTDSSGCGMMGDMGMTGNNGQKPLGKTDGGMPMRQPPAPVSPAPAPAPLTVQAQVPTAEVGANDVRVLVRRGDVVVKGATVALKSAMTTMDMGSERAAAREVTPGEYHATVRFSMAGPWRITVTASEGGQTASTTVDMNAR